MNDNKQHDINRMKAELSIIRANCNKLEKENSELKMERAKYILSKGQIEESLKRKLETQQKEDRIIETQMKHFKISDNALQSHQISPRFILENTITTHSLCTEENLKRLTFFRDYFFDDFYSFESPKLFEMLENAMRTDTRSFTKLFAIFSCKRNVFTRFCRMIFDNHIFLSIKIDILENIPPEWTIEFLESDLKRFIGENKTALRGYVCNMASKCPLSLHYVLDKSDFNEMLKDQSAIGYQIIFEICKNRIQGYVDATNVHLVPNECLKIMFLEDWFE